MAVKKDKIANYTSVLGGSGQDAGGHGPGHAGPGELLRL